MIMVLINIYLFIHSFRVNHKNYGNTCQYLHIQHTHNKMLGTQLYIYTKRHCQLNTSCHIRPYDEFNVTSIYEYIATLLLYSN